MTKRPSRAGRPDRRRAQGPVVAGKRAVAEAIRRGLVVEVMVSDAAGRTQGLREVEDAASVAGVPVRRRPRADLDALAADHRGVLARTRSRADRAISERELSTLPFADDAIAVVLDGIEDPQNLGAAARSAEAAGASLLVTRTRRAADVTPAAIRASAGALVHLPHARVANIPRALARLGEAGFTVIGLTGEAADTIYSHPCPAGRVAIVVGAEGTGMSRLVHERCDELVAIPMLGRVSSLNASASLAAALFGYVLPSRPGPDPRGGR